ncbi:glycosyltransferase [Xinfangfangia sp. CPCC 101601]|uniref:Glycosyltransferase n=1 Tax=Pseudogemmobacter lacusdianii TaxID=3069608 RepID=A0ABU0W039_9RHOB|nr:glycosyltransferase [Xinfangfangia sp. CPCC 101601]MDQ2067374.1 glycosyltransferase [Xinfangfangia sp. CPCC 101601]
MLLLIAPAPLLQIEPGRWALEEKFASGMKLHCEAWPGKVRVLLRRPVGFQAGDSLPDTEGWFELALMEPGQPPEPAHLRGASVICASADMHELYGLPALIERPAQKLVYAVEYPLETQLQILRLDRQMGVLRKLRSAVWHLGQERRRRQAFRVADGVQANGWPAAESYGGLNANLLMYLDGRMTADLFATPEDMATRAERLRSGAPLRIVHSGRLEPLKGAQDLLPFARALRALGVDFTLDIYGDGSLAEGVRQGLADPGLQGRVRLHRPVPFRSGLVPILRREADLFLSCHRQSDPSCSYIEAMGCGLPVGGYDNRMWRGLLGESGAGLLVPMGRYAALAAGIAGWDRDREDLIAKASAALTYAQAHGFEQEFGLRMQQLRALKAG